jgi:serine/threonine protein kinase
MTEIVDGLDNTLYLDRFTILKTIGEGSFGKVKLAVDTR